MRLETVPRQPERFPLVANRLLGTFLKVLEPHPEVRRKFQDMIKNYVPADELDAILNPDFPALSAEVRRLEQESAVRDQRSEDPEPFSPPVGQT